MDRTVIEFKPMVYPQCTPKRTRGLLVGDYLVVSYATQDLEKFCYTVYNTNGRRLLKTTYTDLDDALEIAEWMNEKYQDYFPIWEEYPNADIFGLARWSIRNGIKFYELIHRLNNGK